MLESWTLLKESPTFALVAIVIMFIIVMLTLMVCSVNLSTAFKKGEMIRESCGMEYLEAETERRAIQMAWEGENGVERIFKASLAMFLAMAGIGLLVLGLDILYRALRTNFDTISMSLYNAYDGWRKWLLIIIGLVILSSLVTLQTVAGLVIGGKWWKNSFTNIDDYLKPQVYAPLTTIIGTVGIASIIGLGILHIHEGGIVKEWVLLGLTLFVLSFLIPLIKQYTYFKFYIDDYKRIGRDEVMTEKVKSDQNSEKYLKQHIADNGNKDDYTKLQDANELFLYIMHRDGKEGEFLSAENITNTVIDEIRKKVNDLLDKLVLDNDLLRVLKENLDRNMKSIVDGGNLTVTGERIKEVINQSLGSDIIKICSLVRLGRETPACEGRALLKNALGAHLQWIQTNSGGEVFTVGQWKAKIDDFVQSNVFIDSDTIIPRSTAKEVAEYALELEASGIKDDASVSEAIITAFVSKLIRVNGITQTSEETTQAELTQFNQAMLGKSIAEFLNEKVDEMLDIVKSESDKRVALQKAMLTLRQHPLPAEAKKFVDIIYPFCVLIMVSCLCALFLWVFYATRESGKGIVFGSLAMIVLVVVMAIVGWFLGVYWLQ